MKKVLTFLLILLLFIKLNAQEKEPKTGWRFGGALPAVSYDNNLGFQYGALFEFFNYGKPSVYPQFLDHTYTEVSRYTKGSGVYRFMFESNHIIPGVEWISDLSYLPDRASQFYGFNGYESVYNVDWMTKDEAGYKSAMFYRYEKNQFRFRNDFIGKLSGDHMKWSAGFALNNFSVGSVNIEKLNKGRKSDNLLPSLDSIPGAFEIYQSLGLITPEEAKGGWVNTIKAGLVWDSRDNRANPMKGIWTETGIEISPKFLGSDWGFSKFYIAHRQYFTLVKNNLSFAYRLMYQTTISGKAPFFYQSQVMTYRLTGYSNEGLGGVSTLRGVLKNRVVGDAFALGNFELRWKPWHFNLFKRESYLGLDLFYDFGVITKDISFPSDLQSRFNDLQLPAGYNYSEIFNTGRDKLHHDVGISIMPVWGENFVVAIDIGKAFNAQDGNIGFSIGLNYLF
jgi:outer membrane protein assembly factor BamA